MALIIFAFLITNSVKGENPTTTTATSINSTTQIVTLSVSVLNGITSSNVYNLTTNQIVTLIGLTGQVNNGPYIHFYFPNGNISTKTFSGTATLPTSPFNTFSGLSAISIVCSSGGTVSSTFSIVTPSTNSLPITPVNSVVIPSDATGNVEIILESSSDMVNWIPSQAGTYGGTYSNRFFRVRALAQ